MNNDPIQQIRQAEQDAEERISLAREAASHQRLETEQQVAQLFAQAEADAQREAAAQTQRILRQAEEEAEYLRKQGLQQTEALRHTLLHRTTEAAERIVNAILPRGSSC